MQGAPAGGDGPPPPVPLPARGARHHPFSSGTQYADWEANNCELCRKGVGYGFAPMEWRCVLQKAISFAAVDDGTVSEEVARRMGYLDNKGHHSWPCPEWEPDPDQGCSRRQVAQWQAFTDLSGLPKWLAWRDGVVRKLADAIRNQQRWRDLPVLADALQEAGCENATVLHHLRKGHRPGDSGCAFVDLLLDEVGRVG